MREETTMTVEILMARHGQLIPVTHRDVFEGEMEGMIAAEKEEFGDTEEAARRISVKARCRARNCLRDAQRERKRKVDLDPMLDAGVDFPSVQGEPGEDYEIAEVVAKIDENLNEDELKLARLMRDGATEVEAAEALSLPRTTVEAQWKNLQAKMRRLMAKYA